MTDKNVQILDLQGNNLYPKTKGSIVINNTGDNLGTVEAGAQVNKIEKIKLNGVELNIVSKAVDIKVPAAAEYTIVKAETADNDMAATYQLTKDGTAIGAKINIPKDMVVQSGSVKTATAANNPVEGYKKGDKYIDLVLANADNSHIYILVSDLVDVYTAGPAVNITNNEISVDVEALKNTFAQKTEVTTALAGKADKAITLAGYGIADAYTQAQVDSKIAALNYITYVELA